VGDGRNNTVIVTTSSSAPIFKTIDSLYDGTGTTKARDILVQDLALSANVEIGSLTKTLLQIDGLINGKFVNMRFVGNVGATNNLVYITDSVSNTRNVTFDNCTFTNGGSGVNVVVQGSGIASVRINNSYFENLSVTGYAVGATVNGFSSVKNFFGNVAVPRLTNNNSTFVSLGDNFYGTGSGNLSGLTLGRQNVGGSITSSVPTGSPTVITQLSSGAGSFDYQLDDGSAYRFGTVKFTVTGSATTFEDDYTETGTSLGGNLFINNAGYLSCSVTTAATLKYNLKQYI
jgi:hypothetical protein